MKARRQRSLGEVVHVHGADELWPLLHRQYEAGASLEDLARRTGLVRSRLAGEPAC